MDKRHSGVTRQPNDSLRHPHAFSQPPRSRRRPTSTRAFARALHLGLIPLLSRTKTKMAPPPRRFPTAAQIKRLHIMFVANAPPSRPALLESIISTFIKTAHSKEHEEQRNPFQLAAILAKQMMENRAFADGNKSTALLAANTFIILNGYMHADRWGMWQLMTPQPLGPDRTKSLANAHVKVARGEWSAGELSWYYKKAAEDPISISGSAYAPEWNEEEQ